VWFSLAIFGGSDLRIGWDFRRALAICVFKFWQGRIFLLGVAGRAVGWRRCAMQCPLVGLVTGGADVAGAGAWRW